MRPYQRTLGMVVSGLAVAGAIASVQYATTELPAASQVPSAASSSTSPDTAKHKEKFTATYVPKGFEVVERYTSGNGRAATAEGADPTVPTSRIVKYNNDPDGPPAPEDVRLASFDISITTGVSRINLAQRAAAKSNASLVRIHGREALLKTQNEERGLTMVTWYVEDLRLRVVGKRMGKEQVLRVAEGMRAHNDTETRH